jgi:hypothetical protein
LRTLLVLLLAIGSLIVTPQAKAVPVSLELLLLVDVSGSIDAGEYDLQKAGYVNAFENASIQSAIAALADGIAVAYVEWSGAAQQSLLVDWTHLTGGASADAFAAAIGAGARAFSGLTATGSAINYGVPLFANGFEGSRLVIDMSGDGSQNNGANTLTAATAAAAAGIVINGLVVGGDPSVQNFYQNNIVDPTGGFRVDAASFADFEDALLDKIGREVVVIPEPASIALIGGGLILLGLYRRRSRVS